MLKDDGWTVQTDSNGPVVCECTQKKHAQERLQAAMIPDEFKNARLDRYKRTDEHQQILYQGIVEYLKAFRDIKNTTRNSIGFIAKFGEQRLREIRNRDERARLKRKHNNFGLGKTHLQIAAAKHLIAQGHGVLVVSDVALMDELMQAKMIGDGGEEYNRIFGAVVRTPVLVWDEIGKSNPTESKLAMYFQIINERYKAQRPILYSSNEDPETLEDRIGHGATSRLLGMSRGRIYRVEGPDYRLTGE